MPVAWSDIDRFIDGETSPEVRDHLNEIVDDVNAHVPDVDNPHETTIGNLFDTDAASPADGDVLQYEADSALWVARSLTPVEALEKDGDVVDGHVAVWTAEEKLADAGYSPYDAGWNAYWIQGRAVADTAPSDGQAVLWNAANNRWEPGDPSGGGGSGAVDSVFGRTGAVVAAASDYDASQVDNDSLLVAGAKVSDALDTLGTALGDKAAASHTHAASGLTNDSSVSGSSLKDALNTLLAAVGGGSGGGIPEVAHVGAPAVSGYSLGDRVRDSLGAVLRCTSVTGAGAWCQETPGVIYGGEHAFPTDADVRSGSWLGDVGSSGYRVRVETGYADYRRWDIEWTLQRTSSGTDYLWVASVPQRLAFQSVGGLDFNAAHAEAAVLLHQPPGNLVASDLGIYGVLLEGVAGYVSTVVADSGSNYLRTRIYADQGGGETPLGELAWDTSGSHRSAYSAMDTAGEMLPFTANADACRLLATIEEVGTISSSSLTGLALYADVRWYHLEIYGGY